MGIHSKRKNLPVSRTPGGIRLLKAPAAWDDAGEASCVTSETMSEGGWMVRGDLYFFDS